MAKIEVLRCTSCGSNKVKDLGNGIGKCEHCESTMLLPKKNAEIISLLNNAYIYRENFNYDLAIKSYQYVLEKDSQELSAYEGILLSEYGIEYVKDAYSNKLIPTCHRAHFKSILEDDNYKALMTLADDEQKKVIEHKALEIDKLQKAIERQLKNEESFDVFISYKATDKNGNKTEDSIIARNIYEELTNKNYKVFFSEKSLEDRLGSEYEPIIFKALHTSKIFILVGTSKKNVESNWVRNEWSRFLDRIKNEPQLLSGNNFIPVFKDMSPYDMPKVNNNFVQGVDATKLGYTLTILDGVQKLLKPEKEKRVLDTFDNVENIEQFEKIRKQRNKELKQKNWKDLQTNPAKKKQKILYNLFLASPYILSLIALCMLFDKRTWFSAEPLFGFFILFISLSFCMFILTLCIQTNLYNLKLLINTIFPCALILISVFSFVLCHTVVPVTIYGAPAFKLPSAKYYNGLMYSVPEKGYCNVYNNGTLEYFTKEINGEKHLIFPDEINGMKINQFSIMIPDDIDVVCLPSLEEHKETSADLGQTYLSIQITKKSKLKAIYCSSTCEHISFGYYFFVYPDSYGASSGDKTDIPIYFSSTIPQYADSYFTNIQIGTYPYK